MPHRIAKGYIDLSWGQAHYRAVAGMDDGMPMVMLHQSPLSSRNYERLLPVLADAGYRGYALDTPGYGNSSAVPEDWEVADYGRLVWDAADALGHKGRIAVFGRATGAVFALEAALQHPERVSCLVLHGMPVYSDAERADRMANFAPPIAPGDDGDHLQRIWSRIRGEYPWIGAELATHFTHDFLAAGADFARSYRAIWRYDLPRRVRDASDRLPPTLLIGGTADRIAFMHTRAAALLPQADAAVLDGATDFVAEQEPERFAHTITDFLSARRVA